MARPGRGRDSADRDPRAFQAVLTRLETGPHPAIRHAAAWWLLSMVGEERSRQALRAAATEDEDAQVWWVARYASRHLRDHVILFMHTMNRVP